MPPVMIDVDGVPTLFSPVPAHSLEPGDLIADAGPVGGASRATRVVLSRVALELPTAEDLHLWSEYLACPQMLELPARDAMAVFTRSHPRDWRGVVSRMPSNLPVLRAVGARASRGGAR